ncbi:sigma-70 family RNA polymerase sigma factor [Paenibacillus sp. PR3]|uniref:Sigma-70 family RNA polymerase sigma factor n=1 Tax=Paenibacillus terricola TaxID=2763503 RepID=A0ABR8MVG8_9BACL|nr:sigma-70 family RNA polymerase sigma factor [Paenibacillus terricola]MBD3918997.1 sigma-70 family RNA polymerase sigma factor [Paenibacillus terricola]
MDERILGLFRSNVRELDVLTQRNLFLAYRELVFRYIYLILRDHALTEDVIQEGFIKAMESGPKTKVDSNINAWLMQVTRRTAIDFIRKNKKYHLVFDLESVITYEGNGQINSTHELVEKTVQNELLLESLNELTLNQRIILVMRYMENMSYKEIAKELDINEHALGKRIERAKKTLASLFKGKWGENHEIQ